MLFRILRLYVDIKCYQPTYIKKKCNTRNVLNKILIKMDSKMIEIIHNYVT